MFSNFEEEARKVLVLAKEEMQNLNHPYVSSEHLVLGLLKINNPVKEKLKQNKLTYETFKKELIKIVGVGNKKSEFFLYTPLLKRVIENASLEAKENGESVSTTYLFTSLLEEGEGVALRIMMGMNIDIDELYNDFASNLIEKNEPENLLIEKLGINLNQKAIEGKLDPITGRDKEINRVLEILSRRTKNNPLLIGDAGVGKTAIVEALASMIVNGNVPINLKNKRIISLDMATSVAGTKYRGEFEERMHKILKEIEENKDIILFIDEIHTLVGAGGAEGAIDASNIFKPALARGTLRCIGATTTEEYKKYIEKDTALERRFQKVIIDQPNKKTVKNILENLKEIYESYHKVSISDEIIDLIIELSEKYIYDRNQPDKSIDILDEVCAKVSLKESKYLKQYNQLNKQLKETINCKKKAIINNQFSKAKEAKNKEFTLINQINDLELNLYKQKRKKVNKIDVAQVIHSKTGIPIYEILSEKKSILKHIETMLNNDLIGQEQAVKAVTNIAKKIKLGLNDKCYSLLFCGPSGVGKTYLAKLFGEKVVGKNNIIRLDMSEFKEPHSISKIIGSPPGYIGYDENKTILDKIKAKPYSVIILDEIEKAHQDIINLFLQALDEGFIKDNKNNIVRFDSAVIIMTSNIGFHDITVGFNKQNKIETKLINKFSIPFINRVDSTIVFNKLNENDILKIIKQQIKQLKQKYQNKIEIKISNTIIEEIVKECDYDKYGARKIKKLISDKIENQIINSLIDNKEKIYIKKINQPT